MGGLRDPALIARRAATEEKLRHDIAQVDSLQAQYGGLFQDLEELQRSKKAVVGRMAMFAFFGTELGSRVLTRALYGYYYDTLKRRGMPPSDLAEIRKDAVDFEDFPAEVETALIALRLRDAENAMGATDPTFKKITGGLPIDSVAARLVATTALADSASYASLLDSGYLGSGDPTVEVIDALAPLYFTFAQQQQSFNNREELLNGKLAQARFALYGTAVPPDASFSLRIADGVVKGYTYNGTAAPAYTTFYGLYNHYYSYRDVSDDWDLPERWIAPVSTFDRATPLNLVSTNDITGGNSGSPLLNQNLEVVGLIFDGNIESLPNTYLYTDETARAVSVDVRGILEALDEVYDADRIVLELTTGRMVATEDEADAAMGVAVRSGRSFSPEHASRPSGSQRFDEGRGYACQVLDGVEAGSPEPIGDERHRMPRMALGGEILQVAVVARDEQQALAQDRMLPGDPQRSVRVRAGQQCCVP